MARNRYFMETDGLTLDRGAFVAGLEYSSGSCKWLSECAQIWLRG